MYSQYSTVPYPQIPTSGPFPIYLQPQARMPYSNVWRPQQLPYSIGSATIPASHQMFHTFAYPQFPHSSIPQDFQFNPDLHYIVNHNIPLRTQTIPRPPPRPYIHDLTTQPPSSQETTRQHVTGVNQETFNEKRPTGQNMNTLPFKKRKIVCTEAHVYRNPNIRQLYARPEDSLLNYPYSLMYSIAELLSEIDKKKRADAIAAAMAQQQQMAEYANFAPAATGRGPIARPTPVSPRYNPVARSSSNQGRPKTKRMPQKRQENLMAMPRMAFAPQIPYFTKPEDTISAYRPNLMYPGERVRAPIAVATSVIVQPNAGRPK